MVGVNFTPSPHWLRRTGSRLRHPLLDHMAPRPTPAPGRTCLLWALFLPGHLPWKLQYLPGAHSPSLPHSVSSCTDAGGWVPPCAPVTNEECALTVKELGLHPEDERTKSLKGFKLGRGMIGGYCRQRADRVGKVDKRGKASG